MILGINGRIELFEDRIVIFRTSIWKLIFSIFSCQTYKEIPYAELASVQFRNAGIFSNGSVKFIPFQKTKGWTSFFIDEDKVTFAKYYQGRFESMVQTSQNLSQLYQMYHQGQIQAQDFQQRRDHYLNLYTQQAAPGAIGSILEGIWRVF